MFFTYDTRARYVCPCNTYIHGFESIVISMERGYTTACRNGVGDWRDRGKREESRRRSGGEKQSCAASSVASFSLYRGGWMNPAICWERGPSDAATAGPHYLYNLSRDQKLRSNRCLDQQQLNHNIPAPYPIRIHGRVYKTRESPGESPSVPYAFSRSFSSFFVVTSGRAYERTRAAPLELISIDDGRWFRFARPDNWPDVWWTLSNWDVLRLREETARWQRSDSGLECL